MHSLRGNTQIGQQVKAASHIPNKTERKTDIMITKEAIRRTIKQIDDMNEVQHLLPYRAIRQTLQSLINRQDEIDAEEEANHKAVLRAMGDHN